ncbi:MAG: hypothetical protein IKQ10_03780 [Oscillospiraceae bacterium]|nr:hypothetical protein [Oscillospiraceae bacterium]
MKGITVKLWERTQTGTDAFNDPVYALTSTSVDNVLVGQPTTEEVTSSTDLYGKKIEYMLGIPKGDTHDWTDTAVEFFGRTYRTFGDVIEGIEANVPTPWHKKVRVCRYE